MIVILLSTTRQQKPHDPEFICFDTLPECDTDTQTRHLWYSSIADSDKNSSPLDDCITVLCYFFPYVIFFRLFTSFVHIFIKPVTRPSVRPCGVNIFKTLISNRGRWRPLSLFRQVHLGVGKSEYNPPFSGLRAASTYVHVTTISERCDIFVRIYLWTSPRP